MNPNQGENQRANTTKPEYQKSLAEKPRGLWLPGRPIEELVTIPAFNGLILNVFRTKGALFHLIFFLILFRIQTGLQFMVFLIRYNIAMLLIRERSASDLLLKNFHRLLDSRINLAIRFDKLRAEPAKKP